MTVLSFCAYALWVLLAAFVPPGMLHGNTRLFRLFEEARPGSRLGACPCPDQRENTALPVTLRSVGASLTALAAFFFIPPGSLPPFCNMPQGGVVVLLCLFLAFCCAAKLRAVALASAALAFVSLIFFVFARWRGLPGSPENLGTFVAMPVWSVAGPLEFCGFLLLVPIFLAGAARFFRLEGQGMTLPRLGVCALCVTFFCPWNLAPVLPLPAALAAGADFLLFWAKVLCCRALLARFSRLFSLPSRLSLFSFLTLCENRSK